MQPRIRPDEHGCTQIWSGVNGDPQPCNQAGLSVSIAVHPCSSVFGSSISAPAERLRPDSPDGRPFRLPTPRYIYLQPLPMDISLIGRHALVCGASQGIGKATALELARLGARVTLLARDGEKLRAVLGELDRSNGQTHAMLEVDMSVTDMLRA